LEVQSNRFVHRCHARTSITPAGAAEKYCSLRPIVSLTAYCAVTNGDVMLRKLGFVLVLLMVLLQFAYACFAYLDPGAFAAVRGTELFEGRDSDWVRIYASRTMFVALIIGYLLYRRQFKLLAAASLIGLVMPVTDAWLAHEASAAPAVVAKHVATAVFLLVTCFVLRAAQAREV
jgi:hypothetical protein